MVYHVCCPHFCKFLSLLGFRRFFGVLFILVCFVNRTTYGFIVINFSFLITLNRRRLVNETFSFRVIRSMRVDDKTTRRNLVLSWHPSVQVIVD